MRVEHVQIASDDDYWTIPLSKAGQLYELFKTPHAWVKKYAKAKLPPHFVILFQGASDLLASNPHYVEGISGTSVLIARSLDSGQIIRTDLNPNRRKMGIVVIQNPSNPAGPHLFTSHLELGTDQKYVANFLLEASIRQGRFLQRLEENLEFPKKITLSGKAFSGIKAPTRCKFKTSGRRPTATVLYQSYRPEDDSTPSPPPPPPACNAKFGTCVIAGNDLLVELDAIVVKAY